MKMLKLLFCILLFLSVMSQKVTRVEYFIDTDPGFTNAININFSPDTLLNLTETIDLSTFKAGFHILYVRAQNDSGYWNNVYTYPFLVEASNQTDSSAKIIKGEYFFDTDPGFNAANNLPITADISESNINSQKLIDLSSLSFGFHSINLRFKDEFGQWSKPLSRSFTVESYADVTVAPLVKLEYFFDSDPGLALANAIDSITGINFEKSKSLEISALSSGLHILYMRAQNTDGFWSAPFSKAFLAENTSPQAAQITEIEYFADSDPGLGLANKLTFADSAQINISENLNLSTLSLGLHQIYIRAKDEFGNYSITNNHPVLVENGSLFLQNIIETEYFFDSDPGFSLANKISHSADSLININTLINLSSLKEGLHQLFIRSKDVNGNYSINYSRPILVENSSLLLPKISETEYFFDTDPGFGLASKISHSPDSILNVNLHLNLSNLSNGLHQLYLRSKDEFGKYSLNFNRPILVEKGQNNLPHITETEYFFDSDPGYGLANKIDLTADSVINLSANLELSSLNNGFHTLILRAKDMFDNWSINYSQPILVENVHPFSSIYQIKYAFSIGDSVISTDTYNSVQDLNNKSIDFRADVRPLLTDSNYNLNVTAIDEFSNKSMPFSSAFKVVEGSNDTPYVKKLLNNIVLNEGFEPLTVLNFDSIFSDNNLAFGDSLSFMFSKNNNLLEASIDAEKNLVLSSVAFANGNVAMSVTATDKSSASRTSNFIVQINPINQAPTVKNSITDLTLDEDFSSAIGFNLNEVFEDSLDVKYGDHLTYSILKTDSSLFNASISLNNLFISAKINKFGSSSIILAATDDSLALVLDTVLLTIKAVNDAPTVLTSIAAQTLAEDTLGYKITKLKNYFSDVDDDSLNFSVSIISGATNITASLLNDELTLNAQTNQTGNATLRITAFDSQSDSAFQNVQITIQNRNDAPKVSAAIAAQTLAEDTAGITVNNLPNYFADIDLDTLTFKASVITGSTIIGVTINNNSLTIIPKLNQFGSGSIRLIAFDGKGDSVAQDFNVNVLSRNDTPLKFALNLPVENSQLTSIYNSVQFVWYKSSDIEDVNLLYSLQLIGPNLDTLLTNINDSLFIFNPNNRLLYGSNYKWLVKVKDSENALNFSDTAKFSTLARPTMSSSVSIFQNPAIPEYSQFNILASSELKTAPKISITFNTVKENLTVTQINSSKKHYISSYKFLQNGEYTLAINMLAVNDALGDIQKKYSVLMVSASTVATKLSNSNVSLTFASSSFQGSGLIFLESKSNTSTEISSTIKLLKSALLEIDVSKIEKKDKLFIYKKENDQWVKLETKINLKSNKALTNINQFGEFQIIYDAAFNGSNIIPELFALEQNYPNPFNPTTTIKFSLPQDDQVSLIIYNVLGQKVKTLINGYTLAKEYRIVWDGTNEFNTAVASGIYFYQLSTSAKKYHKKNGAFKIGFIV